MKPRNLDEAITALERDLPASDLQIIKDMRDDETYKLHDSVGRWIRNEWALWDNGPLVKWFHEAGLGHADDMSGVILTCLWCDMHTVPRNLAQQIAHYRQYWADIATSIEKDGNVTFQVGEQIVRFNVQKTDLKI
jgi:hypothetical protein